MTRHTRLKRNMRSPIRAARRNKNEERKLRQAESDYQFDGPFGMNTARTSRQALDAVFGVGTRR
jgi:hypothetical protein